MSGDGSTNVHPRPVATGRQIAARETTLARVESLPIIPVKDSLAQIAQIAQIAPAETAIGRPTATARHLVDASVSANTRQAYAGALGRLDAWLDGRQIDDAALAAYLAELHAAGRAVSSAAMAVAAARFRARLAGQADPAGARTARSAPRTGRPCSPRATCRGAAAGASSPTRSPPRAAVWTP